MDGDGEARREAWEHYTEWPLTLLALAFLGAYAWPILDPGLSDSARRACDVVTVVSFAAFVIDYIVRSRSRRRGAGSSRTIYSTSR